MTEQATAPTTQYVRRGDCHLAYQVVGSGELDVLWVPGWFSHVELDWEVPGLGHWLRRLSGLGRLILYDKRGMGMSDPVAPDALPSFDERTEDVAAVLDAAGSRRAVLVGLSEGGTQALVFAARHPERVRAVVAIGAWARLVAGEDGGLGVPRAMLDRTIARTLEHWGSGDDLRLFAPSRADDPLVRSSWARFERRAASPGAVVAYQEMCVDVDCRDELSEVRAPTLVVHARGDRLVPVEQGRHIAATVPGAEYLEVEDPDHALFLGRSADAVLDRVEAFLTGHVPSSPTRLATVLLTDVVGSTDQAVRDGTRLWGDRVTALVETSAQVAVRHGGHVVRSTGDGLLVEFTDPTRALAAGRELHAAADRVGVSLRVGVHVGQVEDSAGDLAGVAVHIAARVMALAQAGETMVTRTVHDVVLGAGPTFAPAGEHELRGVPGRWELFRAT